VSLITKEDMAYAYFDVYDVG